MEIKEHLHGDKKIAEIISESKVIENVNDGLDLLGNIYYAGFDSVIVYEQNITPDFFDLKTGMAGEILQKFSNYRIKLAVIGDFSVYESKSIKDFIYESNNQCHISFVATLNEALQKLA